MIGEAEVFGHAPPLRQLRFCWAAGRVCGSPWMSSDPEYWGVRAGMTPASLGESDETPAFEESS